MVNNVIQNSKVRTVYFNVRLKTILLFLILLLVCYSGFGQNLVPNGGFEQYSTCPTFQSDFPVANWIVPTTGTTDYFHQCATIPNILTPTNRQGHQTPRSGVAYAGLVLYLLSPNVSEYREYLEVKLTSPLVAGKHYYFEMYVSKAEHSWIALADMDVYFSTIRVGSGTFDLYRYSPQLVSTIGIVADELNWTLISGNYMATGGEEYITIGNYSNDANTNYQVIDSTDYFKIAYYYIDDISVELSTCQVNLGADSTLCYGETLTLDATALNATYLWQDNSTNSTFDVTLQGTYWVQITVNNCSVSDTIKIDYNPLLPINLGNDTSLCQGQNILLDATTLNASYLWNDNSTNSSLNVIQQGAYWVQVSLNNCSLSDTVNITYKPLPIVDLGNDTILCHKDVLKLDVTDSNASYLWQDNSINPTFDVIQSGRYVVQVIVNNCSKKDTINVSYTPRILLDLNNDTTICQGEILILNVWNPNAIYLWQDNSMDSIFIVNNRGLYYVKVKNICEFKEDSIFVKFVDCDCDLFISNAFTPNNNGINDTYLPFANCVLELYEFTIYDRWGFLLFKTNNISDSWDGTLNGVHAPIGVYSYKIRYMFINNQEMIKQGKVTLTRFQ